MYEQGEKEQEQKTRASKRVSQKQKAKQSIVACYFLSSLPPFLSALGPDVEGQVRVEPGTDRRPDRRDPGGVLLEPRGAPDPACR